MGYPGMKEIKIEWMHSNLRVAYFFNLVRYRVKFSTPALVARVGHETRDSEHIASADNFSIFALRAGLLCQWPALPYDPQDALRFGASNSIPL